MESTLLPENRRAIPWHWIVLGLLVVVHAGLGVLLFLKGIPEYRAFLVVDGLVSSQSLLLAFWAAFAPQRFYHRFLWSLFLCILLSFVVECGLICPRTTPLGRVLLLSVLFFLIATLLLLLGRRITGWQIETPEKYAISSDYQSYQFGIKHLIALLTVAAVGFGLFRSLYLMNLPSTSPFSSNYVQVLISLLTVNLPLLLFAWLVLATHRRFSVSVMTVLVFVAAFDCVIDPIPKSNLLVYSQSATTGRAGGMRKAPKRGRGVRVVWRCVYQVRRGPHIQTAQIVGICQCLRLVASSNVMNDSVRYARPTVATNTIYRTYLLKANRFLSHAGNGRAFTILTGIAGGLTMI